MKHPSEVLKKGDKVKAIVLAIEPDQRRLSLGVKQLQPDVWETFFDQHRVGDVIHGKVLRLAQLWRFRGDRRRSRRPVPQLRSQWMRTATPIKLEPDRSSTSRSSR